MKYRIGQAVYFMVRGSGEWQYAEVVERRPDGAFWVLTIEGDRTICETLAESWQLRPRADNGRALTTWAHCVWQPREVA